MLFKKVPINTMKRLGSFSVCGLQVKKGLRSLFWAYTDSTSILL